jgi:hypothetical protein
MAIASPNLSSQLEQERRTVSFDSYDLSVRSLIDMLTEEQLDIAPEYQRHFVWDDTRESEFIESVFLGIPIPPLFMATNSDSTWEVVDGVQRLSTLVHFCGTKELRKEHLHKPGPLALEGLNKLTSFVGYTFDQLPKSIQLAFINRPLRVTTLNDKSDLNVRFDLFERLNSGGVKLEPQEIRNCVYNGPFNDKLKSLAKNVNFRKVLHLTPRDRTNGTIEEFVLRFFAFLNSYLEFDHDVEKFLNKYIETANKKMPNDAQLALFTETFDFLASDLKKGISRGQRRSPVTLFEAAAVGTALVLQKKQMPKKGVLQKFLASDALKEHTSSGSNTRKHVRARIELVRDLLTPP